MSSLARARHGGHDQPPAPTTEVARAAADDAFIKAHRENTGQVTPPAEARAES
jgi:hypothetical protein